MREWKSFCVVAGLFGGCLLLLSLAEIAAIEHLNDPEVQRPDPELSPAFRAETALWRANAAIQKKKHEANIEKAESVADDFVAEHFGLVEWLYVPGDINQWDLGESFSHVEAYVAEGTITGTDKLGDTLHPVEYRVVLRVDGPAGPDQNWRMVALEINGDHVLPPF